MTNKIITTEGNVQFQLGDGSGKIINVHPFHVYTIFNTDTVTFHLIAIPMSSGLSLFTSKAEDLEVNGTVYTFEELPDALSEAFAIAGAQARAEIVDELPETGMTNTIYLVPKEDGQGYDEYIYVNGEWELIGDTSIEFDQFVQKTDFSAYTAATDAKIDAVSGAVSDEASRAISAESALSDSIDALEDYIDTVSGITDDLDGRVDILEESLAQEASARTDADNALSGAISSVTEDVAALSGDVTAHTSNTDIHVTAADKTAWADKYTQAQVDGIVSGLNDSIDAVSGAVADETARAQSAETALHDEIENIDLSDYYTKSETSGKTELSTAFAAKQNVLTAGENIVISGDVISAEAGNDVTELTQAEYDALVEAGTVDPDVLYIITDAAPINLNNYYQKSETSSKTEIEDAISAEATARANADTALSGAVDTALLGYINGAEYVSTAKTINFLNGETVIDSIDATDFIKDGMVSNVEISGGSLVIEFNTDAGKEDIVIPLTDIFDPSNYYTKSQTSGATELATAFSGITDRIGEDEEVTAAAFVALNDRIGSAETAISGKQDILSAGTGIDITSNVISVTGGGGTTYTANSGLTIDSNNVIGLDGHFKIVNNSNPQIPSTISDRLHIGYESVSFGYANSAVGQYSIAVGYGNVVGETVYNSNGSMAVGELNKTLNKTEFCSGRYNISNKANTTWGDSGNTLFSVGNGTADNARHNAFEIRQNGDIYITSGGTDIKLQDNLGGGGSSINVVQTTGTSTTDVMSQDAVTSALSEKVNITDNDVSALTDFKVALKLGYDYTSDNISTFYLRRSVAKNGSGVLAYITTTDTNYPSITINGSWDNNGITAITTTNGITSTVTNGVAQITLTGGSLVTVDATASGGGAFIYKQYSSGQTADVVEGAVYDALEELSNIKLDYFYSNETINGAKTFLWGGTSDKPIVFKQSKDEAKIGFSCQNSASTNNEIATFEFRPNTFTINGVSHPLLYLGHYRNTNTAAAGVPQTVIGFRQYDQINNAAYHFLMPLPEKARIPFSLTTSFKNFYAPLGFKVDTGGTMVSADETGLVDLSSEFSGKADTATTYTKSEVDTSLATKANAADLGGLKLQQVTQAEYDVLVSGGTVDASTLYVIVN